MRSMKQMAKEKLKARHNRTALEEVEEDLRLALELQEEEESVKDTIPDQQLDFRQLLIRYKGSVLARGTVLKRPTAACHFLPTMIQKKKNRTLIL